MKKDTQKRLALVMRARAHIKKMREGPVFITDLKAQHLLSELLEHMQEMLAENIKLQTELKFAKALKKINKGNPK